MWCRVTWDNDPTTIFERDETTAIGVRAYASRRMDVARADTLPAEAAAAERPSWADGVVPRPRVLRPISPLELALVALERELD